MSGLLNDMGNMWRTCLILCFAVTEIQRTCSTVVELLELDTNLCSVSNTSHPFYLNDLQYFEVVWNGTNLPSDCELVFKGSYHDRTEGHLHNACVRSVTYSVTDCNFKLEIRQQNNKLLKEMSCGSKKLEELCTDWGQALVLRYVNTDVAGTNNLSVAIGAYRHNPSKQRGIIAGIVLGVVVLIAVVVLVVVCVIKRQKRRRGELQEDKSPNALIEENH